MSTGVFLSIQQSYIPEAQGEARQLVASVNSKLAQLGLPPIEDPLEGPHVCQGRTGLDHHGSSTLAKLGELASKTRPHTYLLNVNPYRLIYVPRDFDEPQVTDFKESIAGQDVNILFGSSKKLLAELLDLANVIGIPLDSGVLGDIVAKKIDDMEPLKDNENDWDLIENTRSAWLLMHEAALLSSEHGVPISLAG